MPVSSYRRLLTGVHYFRLPPGSFLEKSMFAILISVFHFVSLFRTHLRPFCLIRATFRIFFYRSALCANPFIIFLQWYSFLFHRVHSSQLNNHTRNFASREAWNYLCAINPMATLHGVITLAIFQTAFRLAAAPV